MGGLNLKSFLIALLIVYDWLPHCNNYSSTPVDYHQFTYRNFVQNYGSEWGGSIISEISDKKYCYPVNSTSVHPNFQPCDDRHDFASVFVKGRFDFKSEKLSPIPLAWKNPTEGTNGEKNPTDGTKGEGISWANDDNEHPASVRYFATFFGKVEFLSKESPSFVLCVGLSGTEECSNCGDPSDPLTCDNKLSGIRSLVSLKQNNVTLQTFHSDWINNTQDSIEDYRDEPTGCGPDLVPFRFFVLLSPILLSLVVYF